jgi:hypothetical protein
LPCRYAAATKIQAVHRGRNVRRDMDARSSAAKRADSAALAGDLTEMNARYAMMGKAMDAHADNKEKLLLRAAVKDGRGGC